VIQIRDKETGELLGTITEEQLKFLIDNLEEEYEGDEDYYINRATLDLFEQRGIDAGLLELLRKALGTRESVEIEWSGP
jgi:hypothetical protein